MQNKPVKLIEQRLTLIRERYETLRKRSIASGRIQTGRRSPIEVKQELQFLELLLGQVKYLKKDRDKVRSELNEVKQERDQLKANTNELREIASRSTEYSQDNYSNTDEVKHVVMEIPQESLFEHYANIFNMIDMQPIQCKYMKHEWKTEWCRQQGYSPYSSHHWDELAERAWVHYSKAQD